MANASTARRRSKMAIKLYSTNCPRCKTLELLLARADLFFKVETDLTKIIELGFKSAPILEVDGKYMDFNTAVKWIRER